ncbi:hypothetical protein K5P26_07260 [Sphingopyxis sp. XHP0097]|jgi:hypothetical protein|uniref:Uncharacterized protein n=1 Tax=Sphingopyxis jiangsuensis TaxID=2871171 RepID=A0ABS7MDL6_9SPHN|nr:MULTISPECIES: hypothetical protein [Sphingopyxis]MBY4636933.1 hypothetical protein [Sphingopyxis jiangsuensis]
MTGPAKKRCAIVPLSPEEIRRTIIDLFESCRDEPGAPFDETDFLAYLSVNKGAARWSAYRARLRLGRFYNKVEDRLEIYIGEKRKVDRWSIDEFATYLERAVRYRKAGLYGAEYVRERASGCIFQAAVLSFPFIFLGFQKGEFLSTAIASILLCCFLAVVACTLPDYLRYRRILAKWR